MSEHNLMESLNDQPRITYAEILEEMLHASHQANESLTGKGQKDVVLAFICQKSGLDQTVIPTSNLTELKQCVAKFLSRFTQRYNSPKVSRKLERILADKWSHSVLKLPDTFISLLVQKTNTNPGNKEKQASKEPVSEKQKGAVGRKKNYLKKKKLDLS